MIEVRWSDSRILEVLNMFVKPTERSLDTLQHGLRKTRNTDLRLASLRQAEADKSDLAHQETAKDLTTKVEGGYKRSPLRNFMLASSL